MTQTFKGEPSPRHFVFVGTEVYTLTPACFGQSTHRWDDAAECWVQVYFGEIAGRDQDRVQIPWGIFDSGDW